MSIECPMPAQAAALLVAWLEAHGARVTLDDEDLFHVDLDTLDDLESVPPAILAHAVLTLREEIRRILIGRRVLH